MARNEEKAQSMLNRFITLKNEEKKKPKERRPYLASECRDLAEADKWRQQIMREIGRKVAEIQNEGLGEHRLRDLNDEINKLIREKDDEDGVLEKVEGPAEERMRAAKLAEWEALEEIKREARRAVKSGEVASVAPAGILFEEEEDVVEEERQAAREKENEKEREFVVHVPLPDEKEIERMVVEKKKMELLSKYTSEGLLEEQTEAKAMLNIQR
ncbi:Pre-mRNA-splicing factor ISY1-like [Vitis vinifera]|uniref:Pre-mRNA-splicing factor ISY1-like n=1 Tax=Vitis vinifera TaxID=29760 RepID=A0A438CNG6_VITVI|nr:Pre-mRNA-splicing factor ISY1-like [Vitis vinifera]